jgi:hypothetical protein
MLASVDQGLFTSSASIASYSFFFFSFFFFFFNASSHFIVEKWPVEWDFSKGAGAHCHSQTRDRLKRWVEKPQEGHWKSQ